MGGGGISDASSQGSCAGSLWSSRLFRDTNLYLWYFLMLEKQNIGSFELLFQPGQSLE